MYRIVQYKTRFNLNQNYENSVTDWRMIHENGRFEFDWKTLFDRHAGIWGLNFKAWKILVISYDTLIQWFKMTDWHQNDWMASKWLIDKLPNKVFTMHVTIFYLIVRNLNRIHCYKLLLTTQNVQSLIFIWLIKYSFKGSYFSWNNLFHRLFTYSFH